MGFRHVETLPQLKVSQLRELAKIARAYRGKREKGGIYRKLRKDELMREIRRSLASTFPDTIERANKYGIIGIDRMSHQDAQTFKKIADEIIKSETVNLFAHCDDCNSPISTSEYSSCDECGKDLCPDCFTGNEYQIICSGCYQEQEA